MHPYLSAFLTIGVKPYIIAKKNAAISDCILWYIGVKLYIIA